MSQKVSVRLTVNGKAYERRVEPRYLLADFLRHEIGLKGTHIGCEHGVCGACTVMIDGRTARSCLHFAAAVDGAEITTVEGLASEDRLNPIQQAFHEHHALQCGYCTPGFLMTVTEFLQRNPSPSRDEIRIALTNNICRCTGYANIIEAVAAAADAMRGQAGRS
ncbi:MAG: 2Fe-2S iron-sulfur cluster binding domain-containing protein [Rhodospirillales bacterium]|nr:2Fe-2S iron-sulfur cluster binding domain-containing protein [Rhodospirillales bacterium]